MRREVLSTIAAGIIGVLIFGTARAEPTQSDLEKLAAGMAERLSALCPAAAKDDVTAHAKCTDGLRDASFIPFVQSGLLFGGEQQPLRLTKWQLTHFKPSVFQLMYMSLFTYSGKWSITTYEPEHVKVIHIEAYFRNAMPPGEFPYPFWHSAAKWNGYESVNQLSFYLTRDGKVFIVTRAKDGSEADRGPYAHVTPPTFDGNWQWTDANGQLQPHASLFSNRYSAGNPYLQPLDKAYRAFASEARKGKCLECHAPNNKAGMDHLVLLQTPVHVSGEIDRVLKEVKNGEMPEDDIGLPKEIDPQLRTAILQTGTEFRHVLREADAWQAKHPHQGDATP